MKDSILKIKNSTESIDFFIYGDIMDNSEWRWDENDVMPKDIQKLLDEHQGKKINLFVNSGGGSVMAGNSILAQLKRAREKGSYITAYVDGLAGSIASVLIFGADEIKMPSNAYLMIHRAWTWGQGNANDFRKLADDMEKIDEGILNTYEANLKEGVSIDTIKDLMDKETWMTGKEASEYFNITLTDSIEAVACQSDCYKNYKFVPSNLALNVKQDSPSNDNKKEAVIEDNSKEKEIENKQNLELENLLLQIELI